MSDKKKMPADGGGVRKGKPDGVSGTPEAGTPGQVHGRFSGGESAGGAYPNPHTGKSSTDSRSPGHGGQSEIAYYGGSNPNATAGGGILSTAKTEPRIAATPVRQAHEVTAGKQKFDIVEDSGVAAAEATGKVGTDAPSEGDEENPGGG